MRGKILVVDDELHIRALFADTLGAAGYDVVLAENADQALEILKEENIDVVFLDLRLFGMNGIELCRQIRRTNQVSIINAMTGWGALFEIAECREAGFDDYFTKPINPDLLGRTVEEAFEKIQRWQGRYKNLRK